MSPKVLPLILVCWMLYFACHESIRAFLEDSQAGAGTEIDGLAMIVRAGIFHRVFNSSPTGSSVFRQ